MCIDELLNIRHSYVELGAETLFEFELLKDHSRVELGLPESSMVMSDLQQQGIPAFDSVCMPDEVLESAHLVFQELGQGCSNPAALISLVSTNPGISKSLKSEHISKLRGMGFRRDLLDFLISTCRENCGSKSFESVMRVLSVPLAFRDQTSIMSLDRVGTIQSSILSLDEARFIHGANLPIASYILEETLQSDVALHATFVDVCEQKFRQYLHVPAPNENQCDKGADLLDFAKALRSVVSLVEDSSSSKFLGLCFNSNPSEQKFSIFRCCVTVAQFCSSKASSDVASGTNYAAAAFVLMSIAVSIVKKQKTGPASAPQISRNLEQRFIALDHLSDLDQFYRELSEVSDSNCCRFVASWLLAGEGQFFKLFSQHNEILSCLVPLNEKLMFRDCVTFIRKEIFQNYIPSACFLLISNQQAFHKDFANIFSSEQSLDSTTIPQCISPLPPAFLSDVSMRSEGQLVSALFNPDASGSIKPESAASIIANFICSDSEVSPVHVQLIASILYRIKSGENAQCCRIAIETLLPVMEHEGLHGSRQKTGAIDGCWYHDNGFFMGILNGVTPASLDKINCLKDLSVRELLEQIKGELQQGSRVLMQGLQNAASMNGRTGYICSALAAGNPPRWTVNVDATASQPAAQGFFRPDNLQLILYKPFLVNSIFANFILLTRGIAKSQNMWRLTSAQPQRMISDLNDGIPGYVGQAFVALGQLYAANDKSGLFFRLSEMISIAAALLSARNVAWRRPLSGHETEMCMSGILPLLPHVSNDDEDSVAQSLFSLFSPEHYVACFDNALYFDKFYGKQEGATSLSQKMQTHVNGSFRSVLSMLKKLAQANARIATRFMRLYFENITSLFAFYKIEAPNYWVNSLTYGLVKEPMRKSVFHVEAWPEPRQLEVMFHCMNIESVLDVISSKDAFSTFWTCTKALQGFLNHGHAFSLRLSSLKPMFQAVAHAITFHVVKMLTFALASQDKDEVHKKIVRSSYSEVCELCSILLPPRDNQGELETKWLMALPVLREILLQQTSFLSSASYMFLGQPVLADGHLLAASHSPWLLGISDSHARLVSSVSYDGHPLFSFDSAEAPRSSADVMPAVPKPTQSQKFAAVLSKVTESVFDFRGSRSPFVDWLHQVVSCHHATYAPRHLSWQTGALEIKEQARVRIVGLSAAASSMNGRSGVVLMRKGERWEVDVVADGIKEAEKAQFKPANLVLDFSPDFSSSLNADLAADILGLLPVRDHREAPSSVWDDVYVLGRLEYDVWCVLGDRTWSNETDSSIKKLYNTAVVVIVTCIQNVANSEDEVGASKSRLRLLNTTGSTGPMQRLYHPNAQPLHDRVAEFQLKLQKWPVEYTLPAHAACQLLGSFFRTAAISIVSQLPDAPKFDEAALVTICRNFFDWFAKARLHQYEVLDRSNDTNVFSSTTATGLETVRCALHCIMLLPHPQINLTRALTQILPLLHDSAMSTIETHGDLVDTVVSTITKHSVYSLAQFQRDSQVLIHGLTSEKAAEMNGLIGVISGDYNPSTRRWTVLVKVSDGDTRTAALYSKNFSALDTMHLLFAIMLQDGCPSEAFRVVSNRPPLFLKLSNWLMVNHHDANCSRMLIELVASQKFPKISDNLQPRSVMTGVVNVGNTCFIASLFQQLASIPKFVSSLQCAAFGPEGISKSLSKTSRLNLLKELFDKIRNQHQCMSSVDVIDSFQKLGFKIGEMEDVFYVFRLMIGWIVAETSDYDRHKHGDESQMKQTAQDSSFVAGTMVSEFCKHVSWQEGATEHTTQIKDFETLFEQINTVTRDRRYMNSIEEVLKRHFIARPWANDDNKPSDLTLEFEKLPPVLVFGLNPCGNFELSQTDKDPHVPSISREIDMSQCAKLASSAARSNTTYELNGIILHHGLQVNGGHYTSLVRCSDSTWVHINDEATVKVDQRDMDTILQRNGSALPPVDGILPLHLTGKPYGVFYVGKSVSHPCSSVLFDSRLVKCLAKVASPELAQLPCRPTTASATISLCFKLASLFSHDIHRSLELASICTKVFSHSESQSQSQDELMSHFETLASSEDLELLNALCRLRAKDFSSCEKLLRPSLAMKLLQDVDSVSSRELYRRLTLAFEISAPFPEESQNCVCQTVCGMLSTLLPSATVVGARASIMSTKAYAVLKSISNLPTDSPYLRRFSNAPQFIEAVHIMSSHVPAGAESPAAQPPAASRAVAQNAATSNLCVASRIILAFHFLICLCGTTNSILFNFCFD